MCASWVDRKKGYKPSDIARRLESRKVENNDGSIGFGSDLLAETDDSILLKSMLDFNPSVPDSEKQGIIFQATIKAGKKGKITESSFLKACTDVERAYLRLPEKRFHILSTVSIDKKVSLKRHQVAGCSIRFLSTLSRKFEESHLKILDSARNSIVSRPPNNYMYVKIGVSAKSPAAAVNAAFDSLDLVRGIWNLLLNRGSWRIFSAQRLPVNKIMLGPVHSIHSASGALLSDGWWYQPEYTGEVIPFNPGRNLTNMYKFADQARASLRKCKYSHKIHQAILQYVRALDLRDYEASFLKLWSVLEQLTNTIDGNHKTTVRRASIFWVERDYHRQILTHLREYRNRVVHEGSDSHDIEALMYQVKRYVEAALRFHLANGKKFDSMEQVTEFMDLPNDRKILDRKRATLELARHYHT